MEKISLSFVFIPIGAKICTDNLCTCNQIYMIYGSITWYIFFNQKLFIGKRSQDSESVFWVLSTQDYHIVGSITNHFGIGLCSVESAVHGLLSKICLSRHHVIIFGATQAKKKKKRKENDSLNYIIIFYEDIPEPKFCL